jgi:hypothetical protein
MRASLGMDRAYLPHASPSSKDLRLMRAADGQEEVVEGVEYGVPRTDLPVPKKPA